MLLELSIKNFILIEHETINFTSGLNIITGETGAGKSLVIDAINAVTGGRLNKEDIRIGAQKAIIEALFSIDNKSELKALIDDYGIIVEEDNTLLISREVSTSGRSVCRVNGQIVTLSMLKSITESIIDIVGQNEHQLLLNTSKHMDFVDSFGDNSISALKIKIKELINQIKKIEERLEEICGVSSERERKLDLLNYQINEIESARLSGEEENELKNRKVLLTNAEKLLKSISTVYQRIFKGEINIPAVIDVLNECSITIADAAFVDNNLNKYKDLIDNTVFQLEDIKNDIRIYRDNIEFNDTEIEEIEERLDSISKLKRKYGTTIDEILEYKEKAAIEYDELINSEKLVKELENKLKEITDVYKTEASRLTQKRKEFSGKLEKLVEKELQDLNMAGAKFRISIDTNQELINPKGFDKIEFLISPNPGEIEKPLSKIASGGEMSRIMLSIKNALSNIEELVCIIFDEVDAGIGGITATMVGQKLKNISKNVQTICITHLPQIASYADNHILIEKIIYKDNTKTQLKILDKEERIHEIARMMGGDDDSKTSLTHAKELIKNSKQSSLIK